MAAVSDNMDQGGNGAEPPVGDVVDESHNGGPQPYVVVLSVDEDLKAAVKAASRSRYIVETAESPRATRRLLDAGHQGVLLTDASALRDTSSFLQRIHSRYPTVVNVIATPQSASAEFFRTADTDGTYRLLLKPLQHGQTRRCIDAAVTKFIEESPAAPLPSAGLVEKLSERMPGWPWSAVASALAIVLAAVLAGVTVLSPAPDDTGTVAERPAIPEPAAVDGIPRGSPAEVQTGEAYDAEPAVPSEGQAVEPDETAPAMPSDQVAADTETPSEIAPAPPLEADMVPETVAASGGATTEADNRAEVDRLIAAAQTALTADRGGDAETALTEAKALVDTDPRYPLLEAQLSLARERAAGARVRELSRSRDATALLAILGGSEFQSVREQAESALLVIAQEDILAGRIGEAARIRRSLQASAPDSSATRILDSALAREGELALRRAVAAAEAGDFDAADTALAIAEQAGADGYDAAESAVASLRPEAEPVVPPTPPADTRAELAEAAAIEARTALARGDLEAATAGAARLDELEAIATAAAIRDAVRDERRQIASREIRPIRDIRVLEYTMPAYPRIAERRGLEGWVQLILDIDTDGRVTGATVEEMDNGGPFVDSAMDAVTQWRLQPRLWEGEAIPQRIRVRISFNAP